MFWLSFFTLIFIIIISFALFTVYKNIIIVKKGINVDKLRNKINEEERNESIESDALGEPKIHRKLKQHEIKVLKDRHYWSQLVAKFVWILIPIFILFDFLLFLSLSNAYGDISDGIFTIFVVSIWFQIGTLFIGFKEKNLYLDTRSPVFVVSGRIVKDVVTKKN